MSQDNNSQRNIEENSKTQNYPPLEPHREKILVVVKTAPNPSGKYRETVCTAGVSEAGKWIRLYPLPYRYINFYSRYSKYQFIEVELKKRAANKDFRIDSYEPNLNTIKILSKPIPPWERRKSYLLPTISKSFEEILDNYKKYRISLGMFKPQKIIEFKIEKSETDWSQKHKKVLAQQVLFGIQTKMLEKIPFKFSYVFRCEDARCPSHKMQIIDWELYELYRNMKQKYSFSNDVVLEKVKNKWFDEMWREDKDSYLIVGSIYPKPSFNVIGVFWPPKVKS